MKIAIVGLGLMGGSYAKAISKYTNHEVYAISSNSNSVRNAIEEGVIVRNITSEELKDMDMTIVSLPLSSTIEFLTRNAHLFKKGSIVSDICGVKGAVIDAVHDALVSNGVNYISIHPMAGREHNGYEYSISDLFLMRSLIVIDSDDNNRECVDFVEEIHRLIGFTDIVHTTCENHDRIIAYTSQMCHITSNAYVKSPTSREHRGFSGGSFEDLTRVALLNPDIWTELFKMNRDALLSELTLYIDELGKYKDALADEDYDKLHDLLEEGSNIKASIL